MLRGSEFVEFVEFVEFIEFVGFVGFVGHRKAEPLIRENETRRA